MPAKKEDEGSNTSVDLREHEHPGNIFHGANFIAAGKTRTQVLLNGPSFCPFQRAGEVLFEAIHYYDVHTILP